MSETKEKRIRIQPKVLNKLKRVKNYYGFVSYSKLIDSMLEVIDRK